MGQRLKEARIASGCTQSELADAIGTSYASIQRWEKGGLIPAAALNTISNLTNHPVEYFLSSKAELSESKIQSALKLAEIIDTKDNEIDRLKSRIAELERDQKTIDDLKALSENLKIKKKKA